ncbi:uncharacterized protein SAPINGB_P002481 [Magnusiomyces paraingens]|uniref:U3 small nucleolar ribonucleoprotein protein IMP4 n=1 Tax=Magnusiomyces paraingens TaxID=2606893 RepID=A0A5E8BE55_9ASCO|nr:uncharacterized protein SAPINGB_P002481 [Saprochaete ingens]VVT49863.1 unnamed protein product [Saprochaete ingens]
MLRRQARERREFLYRKSLQLQEAQQTLKRQQLRAALASGKPLPRELQEDDRLRNSFKYDESITPSDKAVKVTRDKTSGKPIYVEDSTVDDEYSALSGVADPRVVVTTSRNPSVRLLQFAKEVRMLFPTGLKLNRGAAVLPTLVGACEGAGTSDIIVLHEHRGVPTALTVSHFPHGPTASFSLHNVVMRHDLPNGGGGNISEAYPHLIFDNFTSPLGKRVETILKHLFPPGAKKDSPRVVTFANKGDYISVRHHVYVRTSDGNVELAEVGPRFEMRLYELKLGTIDNKDADIEWKLRGFVRTANRKDYL